MFLICYDYLYEDTEMKKETRDEYEGDSQF